MVFVPSTKAILERYMAKFSKGGKADLNDNHLHCGLDTYESEAVATPACDE